MASKLVICLVFTALTAQCAVVRNEESLKRSARSPCPTCGPPQLPPPQSFPPPPPYYRTQNWSGVARGMDGSQQGVFSGAAASFGDAHPSGEAYSLAATAGSGQDLQDDQQHLMGGFEHSQYSQQNHGSQGGHFSENQDGKFDKDLQQHQHSGFDSNSNAQSAAFSEGHSGQNVASEYNKIDQRKLQSGFGKGEEGFVASGENHVTGQHKLPSGFDSNAQSSSYSGDSYNKQHENGGYFNQHAEKVKDQQQLQSGASNAQSSSYSGDSFNKQHGNGGYFNQQAEQGKHQQRLQSGASNAQSSSYSGDSFNKQHGYGGYFNQHAEQGKDQQKLPSGVASGSNADGSAYTGNANQFLYGASTQQKQFGQRGDQGQDQQQVTQGFGSSVGASGSSGHSDIHKELNGALDLAKQGLQSAQQTGCSTCGKSSYALSNAKSNSGSAVAISVGG